MSSAGLGKLKVWLAGEAGLFPFVTELMLRRGGVTWTEVVMDELVYNLLLKSPQGLGLLGTLRYRYTDLDALKGGELSALLDQAQEVSTIELSVFALAGTLSVPLLTGLTPVPISGVSLVSLLGPTLTNLFSSTDPARPLGLQFNFIDSPYLGGGLNWRPGELRQQVFSLLGTRVSLGA
jgi:hypothetical protein